jgi:predicted nucleic acid-binding Zn finger protein
MGDYSEASGFEMHDCFDAFGSGMCGCSEALGSVMHGYYCSHVEPEPEAEADAGFEYFDENYLAVQVADEHSAVVEFD